MIYMNRLLYIIVEMLNIIIYKIMKVCKTNISKFICFIETCKNIIVDRQMNE